MNCQSVITATYVPNLMQHEILIYTVVKCSIILCRRKSIIIIIIIIFPFLKMDSFFKFQQGFPAKSTCRLCIQ